MAGFKIVLALALLAVTASALPEQFSDLPDQFAEDEFVQDSPPDVASENSDDADDDIKQLHKEASDDVDAFLQSGKSADACKKLADASIKEIKTTASNMQSVLNAVPSGAACANEGAQAVKIAQDAHTKAASKAKSSGSATETAAKAPVKFKSITISEIKAGDCSAFFADPSYKAAKSAATAAAKKDAAAKGELDGAVKALNAAVDAAKKAVAKCSCDVKTRHAKAVAGVKQPDAKAWKKAYLMNCVLAGTAIGSCKVPAVPTITIPTLQAPASTIGCGGYSGNWVKVPKVSTAYKGCYKDNSGGKRDLPKSIGAGTSKQACSDACKGYKYFGRQWKHECYCGNSYGSQGKATTCKCDADNIGGNVNCVYDRAAYEAEPKPSTGTFTYTNMGIKHFASWAHTANAKLVAGDFDGDGRADAALVGGNGWSTIPVAFAKGGGVYHVTNQHLNHFPGWANRAQVASSDVDGDGKADLLLAGPSGWATLPTAFSKGDGKFTVSNHAIKNFASWAHTAHAKLLGGDFNGDGKGDAALVGGNGWGSIPVAFSKGNGHYDVANHHLAQFPGWAKTAQAVTGDVDGDGKSDIMLAGPSGWGTLPTALSKGDGSFRVVNGPIAHFASWAHTAGVKLVSADFDGDGLDDAAIVGGKGWSSIPVAFSKGDGSYRVTNAHLPGHFSAWAYGAQAVAGEVGKTGCIMLSGPSGWGTMPTACVSK